MDSFSVDFPSALLPFAATCLLIEVTPGPNMTYLALVSAKDGRRTGFATVAGIAVGLALLGLVASFGVAQIIQASNLLYQALRWAGVLFLLYLAWEGWNEGTDVVAGPRGTQGKYFARGLITNLLNPKAAFFYVSVLPTFIELDRDTVLQALVLTAIYVGIATAVHLVIVLLAGTLESFLNHPGRETAARRHALAAVCTSNVR